MENQVYRFSNQPFWKGVVSSGIAQIPFFRMPISLVELQLQQEGLRSVPGFGQITLVVSCDRERPGAWVFGIQDKFGEADLFGCDSVFLCRFPPGYFTRVFSVDASTLVNRAVAVSDVLSDKESSTISRIIDFDQFEDRREFFIRFLQQKNCNKDSTSSLVDRYLDYILYSKGDIRLKEIQYHLGCSSRYLQKTLLKHVGLPPKRLGMQARFQFLLPEVLFSDNSIASIAQKYGFFDQPHFDKSFKAMTGLSPVDFRSLFS